MSTTSIYSVCVVSVLFSFACSPSRTGDQADGAAGQSVGRRHVHEGDTHDGHDHAHGKAGKCGQSGHCGEEKQAAVVEGALEEPIKGPVKAGEQAPGDVQLVAAADIVADPQSFAGKNVRVKGTVNGFCHHGRAWFAIDVPGGTPPYLRLVSRPAFNVPQGVMGATVEAFGTVDVQELPRARVEHFEGEHQLGGSKVDGDTVSRPVIRAKGAVFTPAASKAPGSPAPTEASE